MSKNRIKSQTTQHESGLFLPMDPELAALTQDLGAAEMMAIAAVLDCIAKTLEGESGVDPSLN